MCMCISMCVFLLFTYALSHNGPMKNVCVCFCCGSTQSQCFMMSTTFIEYKVALKMICIIICTNTHKNEKQNDEYEEIKYHVQF